MLQVTRELCGEKFVTSSKIIPILNCLNRKTSKLMNELQTPTALTLLNRMRDSIKTRFEFIEENLIMAISTIMDCRFKKIHFAKSLACANAINKISKSIREI